MHLFGSTEDGIDWAGLNTECTTDAYLFVDHNDCFAFMFTMFFIKWFGLTSQQISQGQNYRFTTWWALVDFRFTCGDSFCIGTTTWITALAALGLGQNGIDLIYHRITFHFKADRGKTQ
jgi:hypothetical protein